MASMRSLAPILAASAMLLVQMLIPARGEGLFVEEVTFLTPPYLQNLKTDGIVIMTETDERVILEVVYGESEEYGSKAMMERVASGGGTWFHRALLLGTDTRDGVSLCSAVSGRRTPNGPCAFPHGT